MMRSKTLIPIGLAVVGLLFQATAFATFPDVPSSHSDYEAVLYVQQEDIVSGYPDGTFRPDSAINRAELTKIIIGWKTEKKYIDMCFSAWHYTDVPSDVWYARYLCRASDSHIVGGYPDGTFRPDNKINFAEAAKIIALSDVQYVDLAKTLDGPWYKPHVEYLESKHGIPTDIKAFDQLLTRGQMAEIIYRLSVPQTLPTQTFASLQNAINAQTFDICTAPPTDARIGPSTWRYPMKQEYISLGYLGEILTAEDCSRERLMKVSEAGTVGWNTPYITLRSSPSVEFLEFLKKNFECDYGKPSDATCLAWGNRHITSPSELTALRPFIDQIQFDRGWCLNCYKQGYIPKNTN